MLNLHSLFFSLTPLPLDLLEIDPFSTSVSAFAATAFCLSFIAKRITDHVPTALKGSKNASAMNVICVSASGSVL